MEYLLRLILINESVINVDKVKEIPTSNYGRVIEINIPARFYWDINGDFDGVEFTTIDLSESELNLIGEILSQFMLMKEDSNG